MTRRDQIVQALESVGGVATLEEIYSLVGAVQTDGLSDGQKAGIRKTIEDHSSDSSNWNGTRPDMFYSVRGIGAGVWGLRILK